MGHNLGIEQMNIHPHIRGIETRKTKGIKKLNNNNNETNTQQQAK